MLEAEGAQLEGLAGQGLAALAAAEGRPTRDRLIANYCESVRTMGELGVRVLCYNFMPVFDWMRTDLAMPLPKSVLCSSCRKTYPEGWKRCPYCGHDPARARTPSARADRRVGALDQLERGASAPHVRRPVVHVADPLAEDGLVLLRERCEVRTTTGLTESDLASRLADVDALIVRSETKVTAAVFAAGKQNERKRHFHDDEGDE